MPAIKFIKTTQNVINMLGHETKARYEIKRNVDNCSRVVITFYKKKILVKKRDTISLTVAQF